MTGAGGKPAAKRSGRGSARRTAAVAIVLRRRDFRESSRIVTCLSREHGKLTGLAKGAHRPDSPFLGRLDFLNELEATFSADRGGLRLLLEARLVRERRALRDPMRFLAAGHVAWLVDAATEEGRPEPALFDLLHGGLNLIERCPGASLPQVVLGLELRYLDALGALPDLERCSQCGTDLVGGAYREAESLALACRIHAGTPRQPVPGPALELLRALRATSGRQWPELPLTDAVPAAAPLPAQWLAAALEQRAPYRRLVFPDRTPARGRATTNGKTTGGAN